MGNGIEFKITRGRLLAFLLLPGLAALIILSALNGTSFEFSHFYSYSIAFSSTDVFLFFAVFAILASAAAFLSKGAKSLKVRFNLRLPRSKMAIAAVLGVILLLLVQIPNMTAPAHGIDEGGHALAGYFILESVKSAAHPSQLVGALNGFMDKYGGYFPNFVLHYPPIPSIVFALSYVIFGMSNISAALPSFVAGLVLAFLLYHLLLDIGIKKDIAIYFPFLAVSLTGLFYLMGRPLTDVIMYAFIMLSWIQMRRAMRSNNTTDWMLFGVFQGFGILSKFEFGIAMAAFFLIVAAKYYKTGLKNALKNLLISYSVTLLLIFPWFFLALIKVPYLRAMWLPHTPIIMDLLPALGYDIPYQFVCQTPVEHFIVTLAGILEDFKFILLLLPVGIYGLVRKKGKILKGGALDNPIFEPLLFLLVYFSVFFLTVRCNVPRAVIPMEIALLVLLAIGIDRILSKGDSKIIRILLVLVICLNLLYCFGVVADFVVSPIQTYHEAVIAQALLSYEWEQATDYVVENYDGDIVVDIGEPVAFYLIMNGDVDRHILQAASTHLEAHDDSIAALCGKGNAILTPFELPEARFNLDKTFIQKKSKKSLFIYSCQGVA